jgi:hypothetical protein
MATVIRTVRWFFRPRRAANSALDYSAHGL